MAAVTNQQIKPTAPKQHTCKGGKIRTRLLVITRLHNASITTNRIDKIRASIGNYSQRSHPSDYKGNRQMKLVIISIEDTSGTS